MKPLHLILTIFLFSILYSCKVKNSTFTKYQFAKPEDVGMISDSLAKIDEMVMNFVNEKKYPGAVTLIAKNGKIIYESEVGWSDSLKTEPYRKDHLFRMASMTKPIVSVAAMQLIEKGKMSLDDLVSKYIPSFNETEVLTSFNAADTTFTSKPSKTTPTIRQLLTHTAGVPYGFMNPPVYGAILAKNNIPDLSTYLPLTIEETMSKMGNLPLAHEPGKKWQYGLNTDVLGRVIEVVSGEKLDVYIQKNILNPLDIDMLDFYFDSSQKSNLTKVFVPNRKKTITQVSNMGKMYISDYPTDGAKTYLSGGSGMTGTARDYFIFCQAMLNNGQLYNKRILEEKTALAMHKNQIDTIPYPWGAAKFGFGFDVSKEHPFRPDGTYSWSGAFSTVFWIDPSNQLIVIQLRQVLQSPNNQNINRQLEKIVYNSFAK
ncbi:serine hydrolase [Polaribacter sp. Hel_I_88]|uniref:serine hydrolase domain-containing protein n=1 Tax=Polaribacter sp. Hel_I_88 TaxID=1250006 RepID=UPI00047ABAFF|nr:serine hydrolase domain-containing protein [Polaribacter sp. Hel_I_88]